MSDQINKYTDYSFSPEEASTYTLLLQVSAFSFGYAITHDNRLLASAQNISLDGLADGGELNDLLSASYKKVVIGLPATGLTLVPKNLFSEEHAADFARLLDVKETDKVFAQSIDDENVIIYKTKAELVSLIEKFDLQNTVCSGEGWIKAIVGTYPPDTDLYLQIDNDAVQFLYFSGNNIRFYNAFEFKNPDELAYFTALVTGELKLAAEDITLMISGNVFEGDETISRLTDFYPNISINKLTVLELPEQIVAQQILALAALSLCGSSVAV